MKGITPRKVRTYKVADETYLKAMQRASKEKGNVANLLENTLLCYSAGLEIKAVKAEGNGATAFDVFTISHSEIIEATKK